MLKIAVTGGIACGKSLAGTFLGAEGAAVCEADILAHEVIRSGTEVFRRIVAGFGHEIVDSSGEIDRARLGKRVFSNADELAELNRLVHPEVAKGLARWFESIDRGEVAGVAIVPLLYEAEMLWDWDAVICVAAPMTVRMLWLMERGLSLEEAEQRIGPQMPLWRKMELADYVLFNSGTKEMLRTQTRSVWRRLACRGQKRNG